MNSLLAVEPDQLSAIAASVAGDFLGAEINDEFEAAAAQSTCASRVSIHGAWDGLVTLYCNDHLARRFAATMFRIGEQEVSEDDVRDALDEIANIVAGNIKALLPAPSQLSLPEYLGPVSVFEAECIGKITTEEGEALLVAVQSSAT